MGPGCGSASSLTSHDRPRLLLAHRSRRVNILAGGLTPRRAWSRNMTDEQYRNELKPTLQALLQAYATGRPHRAGSPAARLLTEDHGERARDARALLLSDEIRRAHANACSRKVVEHECEHLTRLDEWDAAAGVLDVALTLLCELHGAHNLARALADIAAYTAEDGKHSGENVYNVLDNLRHE